MATINSDSYEMLLCTTPADEPNYMHVIREPDYLQVVDEPNYLQVVDEPNYLQANDESSHPRASNEASYLQVVQEPDYLQVLDEAEQAVGTTFPRSGENISSVVNQQSKNNYEISEQSIYHEIADDESTYQEVADQESPYQGVTANAEALCNKKTQHENATTEPQIILKRYIRTVALSLTVVGLILAIIIGLMLMLMQPSRQTTMSTELIGNISLESWLKRTSGERGVFKLSMSNDGRLLVFLGQSENFDYLGLFIYRLNDSQVTPLNVSAAGRNLVDAVCTCHGDIIYINHHWPGNNVSITRMSSTYVILKQDNSVEDLKPSCFSACFNEVIYMSSIRGIYKSVDDGQTWNLVVQRDENLIVLFLLMRPVNSYTDDLWLLEENGFAVKKNGFDTFANPIKSFSVYTIDRRNNSSQAPTSHNVRIPILSDSRYVRSTMAFSASVNAIFVLFDSSRNIVHMLSPNNGQYVRQLENDFGKVFNGNSTPSCLAFCVQRDGVMYIGHKNSLIISVFKLILKTP